MSGFAPRARRLAWFFPLAALPAVAQERTGAETPLTIDCVSVKGNARSDEAECVDVRIDDGTHVMTAGRASTNKSDLNGSVWQLENNVSLSFGDTRMQADSARFEFEADKLTFAELRGSPVMMSDFIEAGKSVTGTADTIVYDERDDTLSLKGRATLVVGANEKTISGCAWIYNLDDKTYSAGSSEECAGVQLRLAQPADDESSEGQPEPP